MSDNNTCLNCKKAISAMSLETRCNIRDIEPSTATITPNDYHIHMPLFVMDAVRLLQDHPKFANGLYLQDIVDKYTKENFSSGDIECQVSMTLKDLTDAGFLRITKNGYRTLGPFARLSLARTPRQYTLAWDKLTEMQRVSNGNLGYSSSTTNLLRKRTF